MGVTLNILCRVAKLCNNLHFFFTTWAWWEQPAWKAMGNDSLSIEWGLLY